MAADQLLPCEPQLDHQPLIPLVIYQVMSMDKDAAILLKVGPRYSLTSRIIRIKRRCPQHNVFAVESAIALANRHRRLS